MVIATMTIYAFTVIYFLNMIERVKIILGFNFLTVKTVSAMMAKGVSFLDSRGS